MLLDELSISPIVLQPRLEVCKKDAQQQVPEELRKFLISENPQSNLDTLLDPSVPSPANRRLLQSVVEELKLQTQFNDDSDFSDSECSDDELDPDIFNAIIPLNLRSKHESWHKLKNRSKHNKHSFVMKNLLSNTFY